jgi:cardiolipin synthase
MEIEITLDSKAFCDRLFTDLYDASRTAYIQVMTFEGDQAGSALAEVLMDSDIFDRRLLVDRYSRVMISDRFLFSPANIFDRQLQKEARATWALLQRLKEQSVQVKWTNPLSPLLLRFAARNHKKMIVLDDSVSYIGGFNFSDHNFAWHDMMLRIKDKGIAQCLKKDFMNTWTGRNALAKVNFTDLDLYFFDGTNNHRLFQDVFALIASAEKEIHILTPYLTDPFFQPLALARQRGVQVHMIAPGGNNKPLVTENLMWQARQNDLSLYFIPDRMSHLKAMLIDDRYLLVGSCNFDYISYTVQQELLAVIRNRGFIAEFKQMILHKNMALAVPWDGRADDKKLAQANRQLNFTLRLGVALAKSFNHSP